MGRAIEHRFAAAIITLVGLGPTLSAQWFGGAFVSAGTDHTWGRGGTSGGLLVEGRLKDTTWFVLRGSTAFHWPGMWSTASNYTIPGEPPNEVMEVHRYVLNRFDAALDMKVPYGCTLCPNGYFRGGYLMVGAGWRHAWLRDERTLTESAFGIHAVSATVRGYDQAMLRLTGGAEINGPWGGIFGEVMFTAANSLFSSTRHIVFVNTLTATIGYRFSLKRLPAPREEE